MAGDAEARDGGGDVPGCRLRLFVTGGSLYSRRALATVADLRDRLPGLRCEVEVVDLLEHPDRAGAERIMATPTLIRLEPGPTRRIVGDLRDADSLMVVLELDLLLRERAAGGGAVA